MSAVITWAGVIILVITAAVAIEAYVRRDRKHRSLAETFKGENGDDTGKIPLGMEAVDPKVMEEAERTRRLSGDLMDVKVKRR